MCARLEIIDMLKIRVRRISNTYVANESLINDYREVLEMLERKSKMASIYELNKDYAELSAMLEAAKRKKEIQAFKIHWKCDCSVKKKIENG